MTESRFKVMCIVGLGTHLCNSMIETGQKRSKTAQCIIALKFLVSNSNLNTGFSVLKENAVVTQFCVFF